jgi:hypothetical protein
VKRYAVLALLACALFLATGAYADSVVFSDNFSSDPLNLAVQYLNGWNVTAGNVDVIGTTPPSTVSYAFYGPGHYLDMDGSQTQSVPDENGTIVTTQSFGPGTYTLTFDLGNNPGSGYNHYDPNTLAVSLGSTSIANLTTTNTPQDGLLPYTLQTFTFTTTGGNLSFAQGGPADNQGSILGNVVLTQTPEAPAGYSFLLLAPFVLGVAALRRKLES